MTPPFLITIGAISVLVGGVILSEAVTLIGALVIVIGVATLYSEDER